MEPFPYHSNNEPSSWGLDRLTSALISNTAFARGRYREAYTGFYLAPASKKGNRCVVKEERDTNFWSGHTYKNRLEIHRIANGLAEEFNQAKISPEKVEYVGVAACVETSTTEDTDLVVEDFLDGDFTKWTNNYGYISDDSITMAAFMHWSFVKTQGLLMVADLQGVRTETTYYLTDPVLMSNTTDHIYGKTDTGIEGMAMFFFTHVCSSMCANLPKPDLEQLLMVMPVNGGVQEEKIEKLAKSTVLAHELVFPSCTSIYSPRLLDDMNDPYQNNVVNRTLNCIDHIVRTLSTF